MLSLLVLMPLQMVMNHLYLGMDRKSLPDPAMHLLQVMMPTHQAMIPRLLATSQWPVVPMPMRQEPCHVPSHPMRMQLEHKRMQPIRTLSPMAPLQQHVQVIH